VLIPPSEKDMWGLYHSGVVAANQWMDANEVLTTRHEIDLTPHL